MQYDYKLGTASPKVCTIISAVSAEIIAYVCVCPCVSARPVALADGTGVAK